MIEVVPTVAKVRARVAAARATGSTVGLVPTMGALHEGHLSLIRRARADGGLVVVSLFVNPTQFGRGEDFDRYPRDPERDAALAEEAGGDVLFAPGVEEVYPAGFSTYIEVEGLSETLEGAVRPGHFRGVATVVAKLFQMVGPDRAYFGQKDYQQLRLVERMTRDLDMPVAIIPMPIVRESDGLAISSRNVYLSAEERRAATVLSRALRAAEASVASGERDPVVLAERAAATIREEPLAQLDYAAVVDAQTLAPLVDLDRPTVLLAAARFGTTRLIDNVVLTPDVSGCGRPGSHV
jgi:pantoate--beta-alanine ligase